LKNAKTQAADCKFLHNQFTLGLPAKSVRKWEMELWRWEKSPSHPNPFKKKFKSTFQIYIDSPFTNRKPQAITQEVVCRQLATDEMAQQKAGRAYVLHKEVSATQMIIMGIDLEEEQ
jgi:hypothetical protein